MKKTDEFQGVYWACDVKSESELYSRLGILYVETSLELFVKKTIQKLQFRQWRKTTNGEYPNNQVGNENPIHMQGSNPGIESEVSGRDRNYRANLTAPYYI